MNLRKTAQGRDCQIRSVVCNGNTETTVLAHFRMIGISGMGIKSPNWLGAWSCSACHSFVDTMRSDAAKLDHALGVFRTLYILEKEGWKWSKA